MRSEDAAVEVVDVDCAVLATDEQERMSCRGFDAAALGIRSVLQVSERDSYKVSAERLRQFTLRLLGEKC